jgi:hypothetical protein
MPISDNVGDREHDKFKDSVASPGVPGVVVVNPDGTSLAGSSGTSMADDAAFTPGGSSVTPAGFLADEAAPDSVNEGDIGAPRMALDRIIWQRELGASSLANGQVTVTTTAATIVAARASRRSVTLINLGTTDVYIGIATVTTANGFLLLGVAGAAVTLFTTAAIQGIVASGTQAVAFFEEYV